MAGPKDSTVIPKVFEGLYEERTLCEVLESMRNCDKTKSYGGLLGLVEQVQEYADRMEAGLYRTKDTASKTHEFLRRKKIAEAMKELEKRWPHFANKNQGRYG